jgi:hypothetical protein
MRARRLVAATVAAVGLLYVSACGRSAPDVAAYVGETRYSIDRVDAIYDDAQAKYRAAVQEEATRTGASAAPDQLVSKLTRQEIVNLLVSLELGKRVAAERQIQISDRVRPEQLARDLRMPPDAQYAQLWGEWIDVFDALSERLPPAELSDASVLAVYQALARAGAIRPGLSIEEVRQAFGQGEFVRTASAISAALTAEAETAGVSINPRYRPVGLPAVVATQQGIAFYALPYVGEDGSVTDLSTPGAGTPAP